MAKLRARDVSHEDEASKYRKIIRRLFDLLRRYNIPIPSDLPQVEIDSPVAMIEVMGQPSGPQSIRAHMPVFDASAPEPFEKTTSQSSESSTHPASHRPSVSTTFASDPTRPSISGSSTTAGPSADPFSLDEPTILSHPHGLDSTQTAVDFVSDFTKHI